jgi:hypothetical protein
MMPRKISPELREKIRQTNEEGRKARAQMQAILDRVAENRRLREEERERKRQSLRYRLNPFRRAA